MSKPENVQRSRRDALKTMLRGAGLLGLGGITWAASLAKHDANPLILRPPGAIDEPDFLQACIKCGSCVEACPYDTLMIAKTGEAVPNGTPYFIARDIPCYMCPDIPCVPVCPSGALDLKQMLAEHHEQSQDINKARMGIAMIDEKSCVAFWGIQCDACYRACPLIGEAIKIEYERNDRTGKHAFLTPAVQADVCTGCGVCEHVCITELASIKVFPRNVVEGKAGNHYMKGWENGEEKSLGKDREADDDFDKVPAEDYLNNWEDLIDD